MILYYNNCLTEPINKVFAHSMPEQNVKEKLIGGRIYKNQ